MNKAELVKAVALELGISPREARKTIEAMIRVTGRTLAAGDSVTISNLYTLRPEKRRASESTARAGRVRVRFRAAPRLLEVIEAGDLKASLRKRSQAFPELT